MFFESLREMKSLIEAEVQKRELADNIKLGPGGIREIEFVIQSLQLVRGGQDERLQVSSLLTALAELRERGLLQEDSASELEHAYRFLRVTEELSADDW